MRYNYNAWERNILSHSTKGNTASLCARAEQYSIAARKTQAEQTQAVLDRILLGVAPDRRDVLQRILGA